MNRFRHAISMPLAGGALFLVLATACHAPRAQVLQIVTEALPTQVEAGTELHLRGYNPGTRPRIVVSQLEDRARPAWRQRVNIERVIPPGPFRLRMALHGRQTPSGRPFDWAQFRRLVVFTTAGGGPDPRLDEVRFVAPTGLPAGALGWDLGPADAPLHPGFVRLAPGDAAFAGARSWPVRRPGEDALLDDGLVGFKRLELATGNGTWRVSLWFEDPGQWEALPVVPTRRILVEGEVALDRTWSTATWLRERYLRGGRGEALLDGDAWERHGQARARPLSVVRTVSDGTLTINLDGDRFRARHLAAVLVEPGPGAAGRDAVVADLERRFREKWVIVTPRTYGGAQPRLRATPFRGTGKPPTDPGTGVSASTVPGGLAVLEAWADAPWFDPSPTWRLDAPRHGERALPTELRFGSWQFRRRGGASSLLELSAQRLVGGSEAQRLDPRLPRRAVVLVRVPLETPPGVYVGRLQLGTRDRLLEVPLHVEVLPLRLPVAGAAIGVYHGTAPHLDWFAELSGERDRQRRCDVALLSGLGLTALAAPLPPLDASDAYLGRLDELALTGFDGDLLDYAGVRDLFTKGGPEAVATAVARLQARATETSRELPLLAIADEPQGDGQRIAALSARLHAAAPGVRLAGQLNAPAHRRFLQHFDTVLLNDGFGLDADDLVRMRRDGPEPWLYNLPDPRLAAGFYLWRSGAGGYLQWHARMPTAAPYDPTDGREDDFHFIYPDADACREPQAIDAGLLAQAEGIADLRWLRWLALRGHDDPRARRLAVTLFRAVPPGWRDAAARTDPRQLRERIVALARTVTDPDDHDPNLAR